MDHPPELLEFVRLFNGQKFFEAHEVLEVLWRREKGAERGFHQGLIQIAAAMVHLQKGTPLGAVRLLQSASKYLTEFLPEHAGIDLEKLLEESSAASEHKGFPKIEFGK